MTCSLKHVGWVTGRSHFSRGRQWSAILQGAQVQQTVPGPHRSVVFFGSLHPWPCPQGYWPVLTLVFLESEKDDTPRNIPFTLIPKIKYNSLDMNIIGIVKSIEVSYMCYHTWSKCYDGGHRCKENKKSHGQQIFCIYRLLRVVQK